ncbi:MAG: hypothetical protein FWH11_11660 [Micrococcales bacterium]|nr:hypothetical protein [Micrococcales bacterium]
MIQVEQVSPARGRHASPAQVDAVSGWVVPAAPRGASGTVAPGRHVAVQTDQVPVRGRHASPAPPDQTDPSRPGRNGSRHASATPTREVPRAEPTGPVRGRHASLAPADQVDPSRVERATRGRYVAQGAAEQARPPPVAAVSAVRGRHASPAPADQVGTSRVRRGVPPRGRHRAEVDAEPTGPDVRRTVRVDQTGAQTVGERHSPSLAVGGERHGPGGADEPCPAGQGAVRGTGPSCPGAAYRPRPGACRPGPRPLPGRPASRYVDRRPSTTPGTAEVNATWPRHGSHVAL